MNVNCQQTLCLSGFAESWWWILEMGTPCQSLCDCLRCPHLSPFIVGVSIIYRSGSSRPWKFLFSRICQVSFWCSFTASWKRRQWDCLQFSRFFQGVLGGPGQDFGICLRQPRAGGDQMRNVVMKFFVHKNKCLKTSAEC